VLIRCASSVTNLTIYRFLKTDFEILQDESVRDYLCTLLFGAGRTMKFT
jgi:hypothetical protein